MQPQYVARPLSCGQVFDAARPQHGPSAQFQWGKMTFQVILATGCKTAPDTSAMRGSCPRVVHNNRRARCPRASKPFLQWPLWPALQHVRAHRSRKKSSMSSRHQSFRNRCTTSTTDDLLAGRAATPVRTINTVPQFALNQGWRATC